MLITLAGMACTPSIVPLERQYTMEHNPTGVILHLSMRAIIQWHRTDLHKAKVLRSEKAGLSSPDIRQSRSRECQKDVCGYMVRQFLKRSSFDILKPSFRRRQIQDLEHNTWGIGERSIQLAFVRGTLAALLSLWY